MIINKLFIRNKNCRISICLVVLLSLYLINKMKITENKLLIKNIKDINRIEIYPLSDIFNVSKKNKTILIFEPNHFHSECSPGYTKYFIDLGFNVDIIMNQYGKDSFSLFEKKEKIRIFFYNNTKEITLLNFNLKIFMNQYSFILVQTITKIKIGLISKLGLLNNKKAIYLFHNTTYYHLLNFTKLKNQYRIWTLGHFNFGLQVVPHYFGKIKIRTKNKKTRFLLFSTINRKYNYIISASERLKEENIDFEFVVIGKTETFSSKNIKVKLKNNFIYLTIM